MGDVVELSQWRARRVAETDIPIGAPPFALEEPCAGCGAQRVSTMVWRQPCAGGERVAFPRIEPHFFCEAGRVVWQEITDAPIPASGWSRILGHFETPLTE